MSVPAGRCGFVLDPEGAGVDLEEFPIIRDLDDWYGHTEAVCCCRESWARSDAGRCRWHATVEGKADLPDSSTDRRLDSAFLVEADLRNADLSGANFPWADLSGADLPDADLSGADLRNANLSKVDCAGLEIEDAGEIRVSSRTRVGSAVPLRSGFRHRPFRFDKFDTAPYWDRRARGYERLRTVFQEKGLDEHHRTLYSYQRRARAKEALRARQPIQWLGNYLSRALTGHGVRVSRVFLWTAVVLLAPWYWYGLVEGWAGEPLRSGPLYYSVVTFVTAPPHPMPAVEGSVDLFPFAVDRGSLTRAVVLFQTYAGTALIVLLGYVLGNRDRI